MSSAKARADVRDTARRTAVVIGMLVATAALLLFVLATRRVLIWIAIAVFFAVALNPAVNWIEHRVSWCRRWLATLVVFLLVFAGIAGLVALFVIPLVDEGTDLYDRWPQIVADIRAGRGPLGNLSERFGVYDYVQRHSDQIRAYLSDLGAPTIAFLGTAARTVAGIVTVFVLAYLMVLQAPKLSQSVLALFPSARAEHIRRVSADCAKTINGYLTGNLLISVICGTLTYLVLKILGIPFAGLIALFVAIADLIPLVGATLGAIVAGIAGFAESVTAGIVVVAFFIAYQQLENHLLQPVIYARTVRLNPLTVLIAILLAVELAGILGALLAIPVAGMVQIIVRDLWDSHRGEPKEVPTTGEDEVPVAPGPGPGPAPRTGPVTGTPG